MDSVCVGVFVYVCVSVCVLGRGWGGDGGTLNMSDIHRSPHSCNVCY